jgi:hypothetical protein
MNYTWTIDTLVKPSVTIESTTYGNVVESIVTEGLTSVFIVQV